MLNYYGVANDFTRLKTISDGSFQSAGNAISKRLEGPKYQKISRGCAPGPLGGPGAQPLENFGILDLLDAWKLHFQHFEKTPFEEIFFCL